MLDSHPPPGTQVRFVRALKKASSKNVGILKGSLNPGRPELSTDRLKVEVDGEEIIVERRDIEEA
jgi:hypothetical protein